MRWVTRTFTARDLPPRRFTAEERKAAGYEVINRVWHLNGRPACSRADHVGAMRMVDGCLQRSPKPNICGRYAAVRMVKSGRYYCDFHAPPKGERERLAEAKGG